MVDLLPGTDDSSAATQIPHLQQTTPSYDVCRKNPFQRSQYCQMRHPPSNLHLGHPGNHITSQHQSPRCHHLWQVQKSQLPQPQFSHHLLQQRTGHLRQQQPEEHHHTKEQTNPPPRLQDSNLILPYHPTQIICCRD